MKTDITTDDVLDGLQWAIHQQGRHTIQPRWVGDSDPETAEAIPADSEDGRGSCRYGSPIDGSPSCIVGWALFKIDRGLYHMSAEEGGSASTLIDALHAKGVKFSGRAARLLVETQSKADDGTPWGDAFAAALPFLANE